MRPVIIDLANREQVARGVSSSNEYIVVLSDGYDLVADSYAKVVSRLQSTGAVLGYGDVAGVDGRVTRLPAWSPILGGVVDYLAPGFVVQTEFLRGVIGQPGSESGAAVRQRLYERDDLHSGRAQLTPLPLVAGGPSATPSTPPPAEGAAAMPVDLAILGDNSADVVETAWDWSWASARAGAEVRVTPIRVDRWRDCEGQLLNRWVALSDAPILAIAHPSSAPPDIAALTHVRAAAARARSGIAGAYAGVDPATVGLATINESLVPTNSRESGTVPRTTPHEVSVLVPGLVALLRSNLVQLGGFHPSLTYHAGLADLCLRSATVGGQPIACPARPVQGLPPRVEPVPREMEHLLWRWRHRMQWDPYLRRGRVGYVHPDILPESQME